MIIAVLVVLGLCFGSFVNALVWRVREQAAESTKKAPNKRYLAQLSITRGRSMCPDCHHELRAKDLVPVLSWLSIGGKCRYCRKPIAAQYPLVELLTAGLFVVSYVWWPSVLTSRRICPPAQLFQGASWPDNLLFGLWLIMLVGFMALLIYDLRWLLLPNRIIYPLGVVAVIMALVTVYAAQKPLLALLNTLLAVAVGGGIFYVLFQVSGGKWIGGGDVKLGWLLGLVVGTPARALLLIFIASLGGSVVLLPLLVSKRLKRTSVIPFGPFLILAAIVVVLFGGDLLAWYRQTFLLVG